MGCHVQQILRRRTAPQGWLGAIMNLSDFLRTIFAIAVSVLTASLIVLFATHAQAGDIEWSGLYRAEGIMMHRPSLDSGTAKSKNYGVHTLLLRPKIVAADGLYITSQLNIFNATDPVLGNQFGDYFGKGPNGANGGPTPTAGYSNTTSESETSSKFRLTQFYVTHVQEYGSLVVGRVPLQFGLGITHNAGRGLFDHYSDTRDLVGYKVSLGNFYFLPMYAKINENKVSGYDDVNEINLHLQYENPESDAAMGVLFQNRKSSKAGNDTPGDALDLNGGTTVSNEYNAKNFNVFYKKEDASYDVAFEVAQQGGKSGFKSSDNKEIEFGGFGAAIEYSYHRPESRNTYGFKAGYATGDDPKTPNEYEGFIFDRNYEVSMFLFNHGLGQADLLHTKLIGRTDRSDTVAPTDNDGTVEGKPDVEAISNVTYLSPYFARKWSDKWSMVATLTTGWLNDNTVHVGANNITTTADLGYELDFSVVFKATEKITWVNQFGYFLPGSAWEVDGTLTADRMYGFVTKAAVSF